MEFTLATIQQYLDPKMLIVVFALWVIGYLLKSTPAVENWMIIWILTTIAIAAAILILGPGVQAIIQGILAACIAIWAHQLIKQTADRLNK